jgi:hypothetical protein
MGVKQGNAGFVFGVLILVFGAHCPWSYSIRCNGRVKKICIGDNAPKHETRNTKNKIFRAVWKRAFVLYLCALQENRLVLLQIRIFGGFMLQGV